MMAKIMVSKKALDAICGKYVTLNCGKKQIKGKFKQESCLSVDGYSFIYYDDFHDCIMSIGSFRPFDMLPEKTEMDKEKERLTLKLWGEGPWYRKLFSLVYKNEDGTYSMNQGECGGSFIHKSSYNYKKLEKFLGKRKS